MIGSQQKRLEVADGDMHPWQPLSGFVGRCHPCGMVLWVLPISTNEASASLRTKLPRNRQNEEGSIINVGNSSLWVFYIAGGDCDISRIAPPWSVNYGA